MKLFFIQHRGTKLYFPAPQGRQGRGGSFTEATDKGDDARIFKTARSAKIFLKAWVKGEYHCYRGGSYDDYEEYVNINPVASRNLNDYEIIEKEIIL